MGVLQRAGALLLINLALQVVERLGPDDGPNIGLGLAWFLLCLVVAGVWGRRDARGEMTVRAVVVLWSVVAVVVAVGAAVLAQAFSTVDLGVLVSDVVTMLPLAVFIVLLPATIGGLVGDRD